MADTTANVNLNYNVGGNALPALQQMAVIQRQLISGAQQLNQLWQQQNVQGGSGGGQGQSGGGGLSWLGGVISTNARIQTQILSNILNVQTQGNYILRSIASMMATGVGGTGGRGGPPPLPRGPRTSSYLGLEGLARRYGGPIGVIASGMGPAGIGLGAGMLANFLAQQTANATAEGSALGQRADLGPNQRSRRIGESIPVFGRVLEAGRNLADAIDGTTEAIRASTRAMVITSISNQTQAEVRRAGTTGKIDLNVARRRHALAAGASPVSFGSFNQTTVEGQLAFQEQMRRMPHLQAIASGERDVAAAGAEVNAIRAALAANQSDLERTRAERSQNRGNLNGIIRPNQQQGGFPPEIEQALNAVPFGRVLRPVLQGMLTLGNGAVGAMFGNPAVAAGLENRPGIQQGAANVQSSNEQVGALEEQRLQLLERMRTATSNLANLESALRRSRIDALREEMSLLQARAQMVSESAQRMGVMNPIQRRLGVMAAEQIAANGIQNTPWFLIQHAQQVAPNLIGRLAERAGEESGDFARLRRLGEFGNTTQPLSQLRNSIEQLAQRISNLTLENEVRTSNRELQGISKTLRDILGVLSARQRTRVLEEEIKLTLQNNQQGVNG